jgi:arylsulfatase A-like enzyme
MGVRRGPWKLVRIEEKAHEYGYKKVELYNLDEDLGERNDLAKRHPELVAELNALLSKHVARVQSGRRPAGRVSDPRPILSDPPGVPTLVEYWRAKGER